MKPTPLECVIFDLDGLLVDSEPAQYKAYAGALADRGIELTHTEWLRWQSIDVSIPRWVGEGGLGLDVEAVRAEKKVIYDRIIAEELTLKPGANTLVYELAGQCTLAVASGSRVESIQGCLAKFGLLDCFNDVFSATTLPRSKPHPDVYLHALSALTANPARTLALEDSTLGMRAALAAGIACVVCPDTSNPSASLDHTGAALVVDSLVQLNYNTLAGLMD